MISKCEITHLDFCGHMFNERDRKKHLNSIKGQRSQFEREKLPEGVRSADLRPETETGGRAQHPQSLGGVVFSVHTCGDRLDTVHQNHVHLMSSRRRFFFSAL